MSGIIRTVTGDIKTDELGVTYCHDHLAVFHIDGVELEDRLYINNQDKTLKELLSYKKAGGSSIVDAQPFGAGRNPELLRFLSESSGVNIIASTGLHKLYFYPENFYSLWTGNKNVGAKVAGEVSTGTGELINLFISEIGDGMWSYDPSDPFTGRSSIKAGLIKIATDVDGLTSYYKMVFEAAAVASMETGAPIMTHTELGLFAEEQIDFLVKKGVKENRIIISHLDRKIDLNRCRRIADRGVFLQFDTIHRPKYHSDEEEARLILALVENGYVGNLLLGMDSTKDRFRSYGADFGLDYILTDFKRLLLRMGLDEKSFRVMVEKNPERALSIENC